MKSPQAALDELRQRADEDFISPDPNQRESGRHSLNLPELGLKLSLTRSRYPNQPDGRDLYVLTVSHIGMAKSPGEVETRTILQWLFGASAESAEAHILSPLVWTFRVPARP